VRRLADENVPLASIQQLRADGCDIEQVLPGAADAAILQQGRRDQRVLVTFDRDFGELIFRVGEAPPPGLLYLRFEPAWPTETADVLRGVFARPEIQIEWFLTVVDRERARQRRLSRSLPAR
jgi:predicted nuclease of predicted toxin-antitoxin system